MQYDRVVLILTNPSAFHSVLRRFSSRPSVKDFSPRPISHDVTETGEESKPRCEKKIQGHIRLYLHHEVFSRPIRCPPVWLHQTKHQSPKKRCSVETQRVFPNAAFTSEELKTSGKIKLSKDQSSWRSFCRGVPVRRRRFSDFNWRTTFDN